MGYAPSKAEFIATATGVGLIVDGARMSVYLFTRHKDRLLFLNRYSVKNLRPQFLHRGIEFLHFLHRELIRSG